MGNHGARVAQVLTQEEEKERREEKKNNKHADFMSASNQESPAWFNEYRLNVEERMVHLEAQVVLKSDEIHTLQQTVQDLAAELEATRRQTAELQAEASKQRIEENEAVMTAKQTTAKQTTAKQTTARKPTVKLPARGSTSTARTTPRGSATTATTTSRARTANSTVTSRGGAYTATARKKTKTDPQNVAEKAPKQVVAKWQETKPLFKVLCSLAPDHK